jgi:hypothetical protein
LGDIGLRQACLLPGLEQGIEQNRFFALDTFDFGFDTWSLHERFDNLVMSLHF